VWAKLAENMYGAFSNRLRRRMYTAWRRKRAGSVRDRVLLSLQSEGMLMVSNSIPVLTKPCESRREVHTHGAGSIENHTDAHCCHVVNLENVIQSHRHDISGEDEKSKHVDICGSDRNCCITRSRHQNNSNVICVRHPSNVSSYSLKGTAI